MSGGTVKLTMKKYLKYLLFITFTTILWGCGGDDEPDNNAGEDYYVKYEAVVTYPYNATVTYSVVTEKGLKNFDSGKSFSQTFGPLKKGFNTMMTVDVRGLSHAICNVRIYIARGTEPFTLKANITGSGVVTARYVIGS